MRNSIQNTKNIRYTHIRVFCDAVKFRLKKTIRILVDRGHENYNEQDICCTLRLNVLKINAEIFSLVAKCLKCIFP